MIRYRSEGKILKKKKGNKETQGLNYRNLA